MFRGAVLTVEQRNKLDQRANWAWQEPYRAAMRERNPDYLRQRLVTAEKAILLRIEALGDAPEDLPELKALREALDSLYAREPNRNITLPQIVQDQEGYEARRQARIKLVGVVAVATIFSFTAGWIVATKILGNNARGASVSESRGNDASSDNSFPDVRQLHRLDSPPEDLRSAPNDLKGLEAKPHVGDVPDIVAPPQEPEASGLPASPNVDAAPKSVTVGPVSQAAKPAHPQTAVELTLPSRENGLASRLSLSQPKAAPELRTEAQTTSLPAIVEQPRTIDIAPKPPEPIPQGSVTVTASGYPSIRVPPELKSQAVGAKLQIGEVISRVNPVYPEDAKRQRLEGIVKLHVSIGTDGSVRDIQAVSGPAPLVAAAADALRQWRYAPTLLAGQAIETGQDFNIVFHLERDPANKN
jgi:TonB family protein